MGEQVATGAVRNGRVVLAREEPFQLGRLTVEPGTRQVHASQRSETVEPRVMQVLVALARAEGAVVSRDDLIERCWDGRIVTDDAINRVLSRIRQLAGGIGEGSFSIETIARVGYRLREDGADERRVVPFPGAPAGAASTGGIDRRTFIGAAAGMAALGAAGGLWWAKPWAHRPAPEASALFDRGTLLLREGLPGQVRQAVSYFEQAVRVDPDYAEAWGALALTYSHQLEGFDAGEAGGLAVRIRAAARRALELDAGNADARLALVFITPYFRHWAAKEAELRAVLRDHPRHWLAHGRLGVLLYQVGRTEDGLAQHRKAVAIEPMLPVAYGYMIGALDTLGRVQEADELVATARSRWPAHPLIGFATFEHLLSSGRPEAAAAYLLDPDARPAGMPAEAFAPQLRLAQALAGGREPARAASVAELATIGADDITSVDFITPAFALLGRGDLALASLERYLLNRGSFGRPTPIGPYTRRYTATLFTPPVRSLREEPTYAALLRLSGLDSYWRQTGTRPDV
ncbi:winged helix-turn-helix domain-containing protein [Sphingomonas sp. BN140010]|uniref:Winged helix-turn-helix domain-containing protein n=1 Tax=Sphingomonas arvum TaxID=2992113 RepID=A0ABT3JDT7_9SPHN|nr:winged helix-turn-helix domain-containing protein [Sphingomonas sp. BN140010]MCW3796930.1 winged helix-turn-helix domain-containing protein [Sphingomonas sp. BN140010]